jgi:flagellin-specific chaperone FliS
MNAYKAYREYNLAHEPRIDTTLALFETLIQRLDKALGALRRGDRETCDRQVAACTLGVGALASACDAPCGDLPATLFALYGVVAQCLQAATEEKLQAALNVLRTLHEGFAGIRQKAVQLERAGQIPPLTTTSTFQASA